MAGREDSIAVRNVLEGTLSADNAMATSVGTAFDPAYALVDEAGAQIVLYINSSDYKMYAQLKDKSGNLIYTSNIIDLPLETMVVNGRYDSVTKEVVLTLDNGNEIRFSVADLVQGLVSTEQLASTLENYVQFTNYATTSKGGVIKVNGDFGSYIDNGILKSSNLPYSSYTSKNNNAFISKGTLENVITGKNLETANNKVTSVSASSTDTQYPSAKLFYDTQKAQNDDIDELQDSVFGDDTIDDEGEVIAFDSSAEHGIINISKYGGNTEQFTTTGKNLCPIDSSNFTPSTTWSSLTGTNANELTNGTKVHLLAGTYRISMPVLSNIDTVQVYVRSGLIVGLETFTMTAEGDIYIRVKAANNSNPVICKTQLESGSSATAWEPYTGAKASPNPDYPQDIHIVSGDNILKIIGKNIFNKDEASYDGSGTVILDNYITVKNNCAYALSGNIVADNDNITLYYYDKNKKQLSTAQITNNNSDKFIFTTPTNTRYLRFSLDTEVINFDTVQLELSNSVSEYEGYKETTQLISLGAENLLYLDNISGEKNGITYNWEGTKLTLNGTATSITDIYNFGWWGAETQIPERLLKAGTYMFSVQGASKENKFNVNAYTKIDGRNTLIISIDRAYKNKINTLENNSYYSNLYITINNGTTFDNETFYFQLEKGSKANSYSSYGTTPIWLGKIGDYQDYIYKNNDKWYLHKEIEKVVLDGSEDNWNIQERANNVYRAYKFFENSSPSSTRGIVLSNYFLFNGGNENIGNIFSSARSIFFYTSITTLNDWKTWLGTHNTKVIYPLETPTDTEITDTTLIYQLNTILYSYKGSTTINQDNNDTPFILTVNGFTDTTNGRINNLNAEILNVQAQIGDINSILTTLDVGNGV